MEEAGRDEIGTGTIPFQEYASSDFGLIDNFLDNECDLDRFIDLIRGENNDFRSQVFDNYDQVFGFEVATNHVSRTSGGLDEFTKVDNMEESCAATAASPSPSTRTMKKQKIEMKSGRKGDRSRILILERRRRGRMKEKLYALRSLVPNITKMDKASIVGDAVSYVQDLQMQAKKLKSEIAAIDSSSLALRSGNNKRTIHNSNKMNAATLCAPIKKIFEMDVFQVEERGFFVRIISNKGKGVAVFLYRALESLTSFHVRTSNLAAAAAENYVLTFTLHITGLEVDVDLPSLKMRIARVFLHQGFDFEIFPSA